MASRNSDTLARAVHEADVERIRACLVSGIDPMTMMTVKDALTEHELPAFFVALLSGNREMVEAFLRNGCGLTTELNSAAEEPSSSLFPSPIDYALTAVLNGKAGSDYIRFIVEEGADVNARSPGGFTGLHAAASLPAWTPCRIGASFSHEFTTTGFGRVRILADFGPLRAPARLDCRLGRGGRGPVSARKRTGLSGVHYFCDFRAGVESAADGKQAWGGRGPGHRSLRCPAVLIGGLTGNPFQAGPRTSALEGPGSVEAPTPSARLIRFRSSGGHALSCFASD